MVFFFFVIFENVDIRFHKSVEDVLFLFVTGSKLKGL